LARPYENIGGYLRDLRVKSGFTQRVVADHLEYSSAQFISNFERGIAIPPLKKLKALLRLYRGNMEKTIELVLSARRAEMRDELNRR
jgi:transcriptional regulator with XRE-family HTH domain